MTTQQIQARIEHLSSIFGRDKLTSASESPLMEIALQLSIIADKLPDSSPAELDELKAQAADMFSRIENMSDRIDKAIDVLSTSGLTSMHEANKRALRILKS